MKKQTNEVVTRFVISKRRNPHRRERVFEFDVEMMTGSVRMLYTLNIGTFKTLEDARECATKARDKHIAKCDKAGCFNDGQNPKEQILLSYTAWDKSFFDDIVDNSPKLDQIDETNIS
tara:strand:+ start:871 stop:1224 length:354 start_codon:yes stop_codon:yes gene_type:complete